ncbi:transforming growth factor beta receptor type 3-like isoform X2 [Ruditapes philippinarum]|uniref:transforming growth factor beta receptor type 3-like isoform X2 n=1 Tax=Ruditapes philippinarum TaxID=129788 RepID=UPI00295A75BB|nr:transforming growth factor beta receptor type 3-like isoform X2 [Ruditapes philippinarum]
MPCKVSSPFNPDLASAFLEAEILPTSGCMTNATSRKSGAEIHVINYQGSKEQNVELLLNDFEKKGFDEPFVIILSSNVTVYWQIRLRQNPKKSWKHTFVVAKGSGLRFAYKHLSSRPTISKPKNLPFESDDLLTWVTKRYSVVTTFTSVPGGNHLTLTVGKAQQSSSSSATCSLTSSDLEEPNVKVISMVSQPVEGCLMQDRYPGPIYKVAYVIELKEVPDVDKFEVHLDLRGHSRQHGERETKLVLKAPSQVTWRVYTKKMQGLIHIVANSYVDMAGIRVETVSVRSEELRETGLDLLRWVQYYLDVPISMYTSMNNSNRIQISFPEIVEKDDRTVKQMKNNLRIALRTECDTKAVTVSVDKTVLQMLGIKKSMLTLLDPHCTASENATHVYIQSSPGACGTSSIATQIGRQALTNALVVHDTNIVTEDIKDHDSLEGSGNEDIFSGSGENEISDVMLDDEDLELQRVQVNFMCIPLQEPKPDIELPPKILPETELQLQLFDNVLFLAPYIRFPVKIEEYNKRLYLQAIAMSDPLLRANMENCWLAPELDNSESSRYSLVEESCGQDSSVQYYVSGTPQSERLTFTLENYIKVATSPTAVLRCDVSICCIDKKCGSYNLPLCPDRSVDCEKQRHGHGNTNRNTQIIIVGTLSLPKQVTSYEGTDSSVVKIETDVPETGEVAGGNKEPLVIEGLDSGTVVGIAFAAFIIGAMMMGALWFIHTHSGKLFSSGPFKRSMGVRETPEHEDGYVETTPGSSVPIST